MDLLVTAYRSHPNSCRSSCEHLLSRSGSARFSTACRRRGSCRRRRSPSRQTHDDPKSRLSSREREVYELLGQGLTNLQIAQLLFISEATVKVHVHHIYDKLGIRSRTALAVQAALERVDQATSAIEDAESELIRRCSARTPGSPVASRVDTPLRPQRESPRRPRRQRCRTGYRPPARGVVARRDLASHRDMVDLTSLRCTRRRRR